MKMVISLLNIDHQNAGIHRFGMLFIEHILNVYPIDDVLLYTTRKYEQFKCKTRTFAPTKNLLHRMYRECVGIPKKLKLDQPDVYIELAHFGPLKKLKSIRYYTVIHDVFAFTHPETQPLISVLAHRALLPLVARKTDCLIVNSQSTLDSLRNRFEGKDAVVFYATTNHSPLPPKKVRSVKNIRILAVGTIEPRKDYTTLLDALRQVVTVNPAISLTIVGAYGWKEKDIQKEMRSPSFDGIRFTGYCSEEELKELYKTSDIFISTSLAEGFGLPLTEAMMYCCACIVTDIPSYREIAQGTAMYFKSKDSHALSQAILHLTTDGHARKEMQQKAHRRFVEVQQLTTQFRL